MAKLNEKIQKVYDSYRPQLYNLTNASIFEDINRIYSNKKLRWKDRVEHAQEELKKLDLTKLNANELGYLQDLNNIILDYRYIKSDKSKLANRELVRSSLHNLGDTVNELYTKEVAGEHSKKEESSPNESIDSYVTPQHIRKPWYKRPLVKVATGITAVALFALGIAHYISGNRQSNEITLKSNKPALHRTYKQEQPHWQGAMAYADNNIPSETEQNLPQPTTDNPSPESVTPDKPGDANQKKLENKIEELKEKTYNKDGTMKTYGNSNLSSGRNAHLIQNYEQKLAYEKKQKERHEKRKEKRANNLTKRKAAKKEVKMQPFEEWRAENLAKYSKKTVGHGNYINHKDGNAPTFTTYEHDNKSLEKKLRKAKSKEQYERAYVILDALGQREDVAKEDLAGKRSNVDELFKKRLDLLEKVVDFHYDKAIKAHKEGNNFIATLHASRGLGIATIMEGAEERYGFSDGRDSTLEIGSLRKQIDQAIDNYVIENGDFNAFLKKVAEEQKLFIEDNNRRDSKHSIGNIGDFVAHLTAGKTVKSIDGIDVPEPGVITSLLSLRIPSTLKGGVYAVGDVGTFADRLVVQDILRQNKGADWLQAYIQLAEDCVPIVGDANTDRIYPTFFIGNFWSKNHERDLRKLVTDYINLKQKVFDTNTRATQEEIVSFIEHYWMIWGIAQAGGNGGGNGGPTPGPKPKPKGIGGGETQWPDIGGR